MAGVALDAPADSRRVFRRSLLVAMILVGVIISGLRAENWFTSASAFSSGNEIGFRDLAEGEQYHVGLVPRGHVPDVTLKNIAVELAPGSGDAATSVRACSLPVGALRGPLPCRARQVEGLDLGSLDASDGLVLTVVPLQDGPVTVDRVIFEFSDGARTGRQPVGPRVVIGDPGLGAKPHD